MATFDLSGNASLFVGIGNPGAVNHASQALNSGGLYLWNSTNGQVSVRSLAGNIVAPPGGAPSSGTANVVTVSDGGDQVFTVSGLSAPVASLAASEETFWRSVLSGSTTFVMPDFTVIYYLAGDFANVAAGENVTGAKDIFTQTFMSGSNTFGGDALNVAATATVHGGDDSITMGGFYAYAGGDAINSDGSVIGGDDTIRVVNSSDTQGSYAAGDVIFVDAGSVTGGDDKITFINPNIFTYVDVISGDVDNSLAGTTITGGNDTITMTGEDSNGGLMAGDVFQATASIATGGKDVLTGTAGDDSIGGDVYSLGNSTVTGGADKISGGAGDDVLSGEVVSFTTGTINAGGKDTINGGTGNDDISGQEGNDTLIGGYGRDSLDGGNGIDTVAFNTIAVGVTVDLSLLGNIGGAWGQGTDSLTDVENVTGSNLADAVAGNSSGNVLSGLLGNDTLFGEDGNDTLSGGSGNDVMTGGSGRDQMSGNAGADDFDFNATSQSGTAFATRDTIIGFQHLTDDIDLSTIDAKASVNGNNPFAFIGGAAFSAEGQVRVRQAGGDTYIDINTSGNSGAEMSIKLEGQITLTAGDFIL